VGWTANQLSASTNAANDLLLKLKTWLDTGGGLGTWTVDSWTPGAADTDQARLHIHGPGAGAGKQVFINIQTRNNPGAGAYGWAVTGSTSYTGGQSWGAQASESPEVFLNLQNAPAIRYWIYGNDRRFIIVAVCDNVYCTLYAGFGLPFALPAEYPFPLYIGGMFSSLAVPGFADARNRFPIDPGDGSAYYRMRAAAGWRKLANHAASIGDVNVNAGTDTCMWPHRVPRGYSGSSATDDWNIRGMTHMRPNVAGEMPIFQPHIIDPAALNMPMALDGIYAAPGFARSPEQQFTIGGVTYDLFLNAARNTGRDYLAIART
jgi:hypothetical protein